MRAATRTDDVHALLLSLLPPGSYFRLNPEVPAMQLDETGSAQLRQLMDIGRQHVSEGGAGREQLVALARALTARPARHEAGARAPRRCSLPGRLLTALRSRL